jgi:hypothetical protein
MTFSPHIAIDEDLDEICHASCPPLYEVLVQRNITGFFTAEKITAEEFHHYCKRLNSALAQRPGSAG